MSVVEFMWIKLLVLVAVVFVVNVIYAAITGRSIEQARRDRSKAPADLPLRPPW